MAVSFKVPGFVQTQAVTIDKLYGIDLTNTPANVSIFRSPNAINMVRETSGKVRKRRGWEILETLTEKINGFHVLKTSTEDKKLIHSGTSLYLWGRDINRTLRSSKR